MSLAKQLFRESALERLSSPEQLDQLLQVTSPKGWISLVAIWTVLVAITVWSIFGSAPTTEEGQGMLVAGGLRQVGAPGAGRLRSILVGVDTKVEQGDLVAEIDKQDLLDQITDAQSELREVRAQHERLREFDESEEKLQDRLAREETDRLNQSIENSHARISRLKDRRVLVADEVKHGGMIKIDLERIEEDVETEELKIEQSRLQIQQLVGKCQVASSQRQREALTRELKADDLARNIENLRNRMQREAFVRSPVAGKVVEIRASEHSSVVVGDPILLLETAGDEPPPPSSPSSSPTPGDVRPQRLHAVLYVSRTGRRIDTIGMPVHLVPSTVKREEYGSLIGKVSYVAPTPTSRSAMMTILSDKDLVERLSLEIGVPLQINVELEPDPDTTSGYKWTSVQGPPITISAGTLCIGSVTVKRQSPISLVIPGLKKALGGD